MAAQQESLFLITSSSFSCHSLIQSRKCSHDCSICFAIVLKNAADLDLPEEVGAPKVNILVKIPSIDYWNRVREAIECP